MEKKFYSNEKRGKAEYGWLSAKYSFSFANYYDPENIHYGVLRVLNDDIISPARGFDTHPHDNMEIITIPLRGALSHKDSIGHESIVNSGEVQVMSAGTGITHSEHNASASEEINLLQIWIFPKEKELKPRYDQKSFSKEKIDQFQLLVSPDGRENSLWINQDAFISLIQLGEDKFVTYEKFNANNGVYFFQIEGKTIIAEENLTDRDAVSVNDMNEIEIKAQSKSWVLILEVPV